MTSTAFERITDALRDTGHLVKDTGHGRAQAQCPAHDDHNPSLAITGIDGQVLIHCHTGCDTDDVLSALSFTRADLFDTRNGATYHYPDRRVVYRTPDKKFRQTGNTKGHSLFHADEIGDAKTVYVAEGEKDVLAIKSAGGAAVCPPQGAGQKNLDRYDWSVLRGLHVIVIQDKDDPGREHAAQVFEITRPIAETVGIVEAAVGKDAADHIAAGKTLDELVPITEDTAPQSDSERAVPGGEFLFGSRYDDGPALWGNGSTVLWCPGEPLMIAAYQGLGKTTLAGQLTRALIGLGGGKVLGFPVADTAARVLYLAMDRPKQIRRSLRRQFTQEETAVLDERLVVWPGPPAADLAAHPTLLLGLAEHHNADVVVVDSLKDAALKLSSDETGAAWNRATQHLLVSDRELLVLHHPRKLAHNEKDRKLTIEDIYGSTWITNGCGSVILLNGEPGDPIIEFRHLKQPNEEVGPFRLSHDPDTGQLLLNHEVDLVALVRRKSTAGLIPKDAARALFDTDEPSRAQTEKARRKLDKLVPDVLYRREGTTGGATGGTPTRTRF